MKVAKAIKTIASGGFGVVEEVELTNGERVARKTFSPNGALGMTPQELDNARSRFRKEVRIQAALDENRFIKVLHHDLSGPDPWFLCHSRTRI